MIHSHARCDRCEKNLIPLGEEAVTEDFLLDAGWIVVKWIEAEGVEGDDGIEANRDFCSLICAARWCAEEAGAQAGRADDRAGA